MSITGWTIGTVAFVDRRTRAAAAWMELFMHVDRAGAALVRPPDYQDSHVVAWGAITTEEVTLLASLGETEFERSDTLAIFSEILEQIDIRQHDMSLFYR